MSFGAALERCATAPEGAIMANRDTNKGKPPRLALKKQTIRDLTTKRSAADAVRGGARPSYTNPCGGG